jgi:hypothetical protein
MAPSALHPFNSLGTSPTSPESRKKCLCVALSSRTSIGSANHNFSIGGGHVPEPWYHGIHKDWAAVTWNEVETGCVLWIQRVKSVETTFGYTTKNDPAKGREEVSGRVGNSRGVFIVADRVGGEASTPWRCHSLCLMSTPFNQPSDR